jgi:ABC-2 type transport system ATP-binding protein
MGEIEKISDIKEVALFGKGLHAVVQRGEAAIATLQKVLEERGYQVERIEKIIPSLEDVFVSLIEARDRAEQPQQEVRR